MFTDPQTVTISTVAKTLPRVPAPGDAGIFKQDTGDNQLAIKHSYGKRSRHTLTLVNTKTTADPLVTGSSFIASMTVGFWVDVPPVGYTVAEASAIVAAVTKFLTDTAGAAVPKIIGGES